MSDLVKRDDVLYALIEKGQKSKRYKLGENWELNLSEIKEAVESVPSAEPEQTLESAIDYLHSVGWLQEHDRILTESAEQERKNGEWIKEDLSGYLTPGGNSIYHCSECGHTEGPWPRPRLTNFCPNCGAKLDWSE